MFGTALSTLILGAVAGVGAWWAADQNRWGWALLLGLLTLVLAVVAVTTAFAGAVALVLKLLPILLIVLVAWLGVKQLQKK